MATTTEISNFIKTLSRLAIAECNKRIANGKGFVLPSVCIAQSALETGWGTAGIMVKANAFFGIKAGGSWTGKVYRADTWEVADGSAYNTTANFRAYDSLAESVTDYFDLITNLSRYSKALSFGTDKTTWKTPKECITSIWSGGYATDTLYVQKIMNTITSRNLTRYDNAITGVYDGGELPAESFTIPFSDLNTTTNGTLILPSEKAFSVTNTTTFTVKINVFNDTPFIDYREQAKLYVNKHIGGDFLPQAFLMNHNETVTLEKGFTYTIEVRVDGVQLNVDNLFIDGTWNGIEFLSSIPATPSGETLNKAIAYFVKIE